MAVMTRITTSMIQRNYQNNLTSTLGGLESARKQVETGRRFEHSYEDPTASAKAAILEKRYARVQDYINNGENAQKWIFTQEDAAMDVNEHATTIRRSYSVAAVNGTNISASTRQTYATAIESLQEAMVAALNAKYGETFVMSGTEGKDPPFILKENAEGIKELYYRDYTSTEGYVPVDDADAVAKFADDHSFIDLGFGMEFDTQGNVLAASAFDMALPGIKLVGYGKSTITLEDGTTQEVSNNIINLAGQMAAELRSDGYTKEAYTVLWDQFDVGAEKLLDEVTILGTKEKQLESTLSRLESEKLQIETQFDSTVNIEPAEAIMNYSWADYAYNSALKVGSSIISPSLLDFVQGR